MPKDDDHNDVLLGSADDGLRAVFHDHVTRRIHERAARLDESSRDNDDVDSDVHLDVTGSDITS